MNSGVWKALTIGGLAICAALWMPRAAWSESITLGASKDNTLFGDTTKSNGAGQFLFAGRTLQSNAIDKRHALLAFDLGDIPERAMIDSVSLTLRMSKSNRAGTGQYDFHRVLSDWGEGSSNASGSEGGGTGATSGDATWNNTFFPGQFWNSPGGDFEPAASASQTVGGIGFYSWSSGQLVADVQSWIDSPESNFGWLLKANNEAIKPSAKQFVSRNSNNGPQRPMLSIEFSLSPQRRAGDANNDSNVDRADLLIVSNHFGDQTAEGFDAGDFNNNGTVDLPDLAILGRNFDRPSPSPIAAAVPEPTAIILSLSGLLLMLGRRTFGRRL